MHEAKVWVPVGNDVSYVIGITVAGAVLSGARTSAALAGISVIALILITYSAGQMIAVQRLAALDPAELVGST